MLTLLSSLAHADMTVCFEDHQGRPLEDFRVTHTEWGWVNDYETDPDGCVEVATWYGVTPVTIWAENRVLQVVDSGLRSHNVMWSRDGDTHTMASEDYVIALDMQENYDNGLYLVDPFFSDRPFGDFGDNRITLDWNSALVFSDPWVEPAPLELYPRIHLSDSDSEETHHHELIHALHFASLPLATRLQLEADYANFLLEEGGHSFSAPSADFVAWVEGIAHLGKVFERVGNGSEDSISDEMYANTFALRGRGDDTIEGVVAGVLFAEFLRHVSLDYLMGTIIDCGSLTLQDYATCIADLEGETSVIFSDLRRAADAFAVDLDVMPEGDWNYCNGNYTCRLAGHGDCDSDAECAYGLTCASNVGMAYGWPSGVDVCEPSGEPLITDELTQTTRL